MNSISSNQGLHLVSKWLISLISVIFHVGTWHFRRDLELTCCLNPRCSGSSLELGWTRRFLPNSSLCQRASTLGPASWKWITFLKPAADTPKLEVKDEELEEIMRKNFQFQVFTVGQTIAVDYNGTLLKFDVRSLMPPDSWTCSVGALEGYHLRKR